MQTDLAVFAVAIQVCIIQSYVRKKIMDRNSRVVGYFGATKHGDVVCDGPACIISGSYKRMKEYLAKSKRKPTGKVKIRKTRFGEVLSGMNMGGAYSFDEESYGRFLPLAREEGMKCEDIDFTPDAEGEVRFYTMTPTRT